MTPGCPVFRSFTLDLASCSSFDLILISLALPALSLDLPLVIPPLTFPLPSLFPLAVHSI